jgi:hypothetical protein
MAEHAARLKVGVDPSAAVGRVGRLRRAVLERAARRSSC